MIDCNCEWCKFYENGCTLENVQIEAQVVTPMGFVPMCNSFIEAGEKND